jgi:tRNA dimethylallyltransferase
MNIGTAKPTQAEMAGVPHHLLDVSEPCDPWSVYRYRQAAYACIAEIAARGKVPILAGGTGLYINAVLFDFDFGEGNGEWRMENGELARNGEWRMENGELARSGEWRMENGELDFTILEMPRDKLYERINARTAAMFSGGLLDEVRALQAAGYNGEAHAPMRGIGYKESALMLRGEISEGEAIEKTAQATRNYAKRQLTWLRHQLRDIQPRIVDVSGKTAIQIVEEILT